MGQSSHIAVEEGRSVKVFYLSHHKDILHSETPAHLPWPVVTSPQGTGTLNTTVEIERHYYITYMIFIWFSRSLLNGLLLFLRTVKSVSIILDDLTFDTDTHMYC